MTDNKGSPYFEFASYQGKYFNKQCYYADPLHHYHDKFENTVQAFSNSCADYGETMSAVFFLTIQNEAVRIDPITKQEYEPMQKDNIQQIQLFQRIAALLAKRDCEGVPNFSGRTPASVALILRQSDDDLEILFIQRAAHDQDPWSGHIAFPGGKWEEGELVCQTARRETMEEIGIDLDKGWYLGRLSDIVGTNLPVRVSCCVYGIGQINSEPVLNEEVSDAFWIKLSDVRDRRRHHLAPVAFDERRSEVPAIRLQSAGKPVLWGITYRLIMQFLELVELLDIGVANSGDCCTLPELVEFNEEDLS